MNSILSIALVSLMLAPPAEDTTVEELADLLAQLEQNGESLHTTFTFTILPTHPLEPPGSWPAEPIIEKRYIEWIAHDGLLRIEEFHSHMVEAGVGTQPGAMFVSVWTGSSWRERRADGTYCRILDSPRRTHKTDCWALFNSVGWPSIAGDESLSHAVRSSRLIGRWVDGSTTRFRFSRNPRDTVELELVVDHEPDFRILSVTIDAKGEPGEQYAGLLKMRVAYVVEAWDRYDGMLLAKRARREATIYRSQSLEARNIKPQTGRTIFERHCARSLVDEPRDPGIFTLAYRPGDIVMDETLRTTYRLGSREISIDGFLFATDNPILKEVGVCLPDVLETARTATPSEAINSRPVRGRRAINRPLTAGIVVFLASIALIVSIRQMRSRRSRASLLFVSVVVIIVSISVVGVVTALIGRHAASGSPLVGASSYDFGEQAYRNGPLELRHTFTLTNRSDATVRIEKVATSCGCTAGAVSREAVEPGGSVEISATLKFDAPGRRRETIWLNLGETGVHTLSLSGIARRAYEFFAVQKAIRLSQDTAGTILLVATGVGNDPEPPTPDIHLPNGTEAHFDGWRLVFGSDEASGRPSRWQGVVKVEQVAAQLERPGKIVISLGQWQEVTVNPTGRPWG